MSNDDSKLFRVWDCDEKRYRDDNVVEGSFLLSMNGDLIVWNDYDRNLHSPNEGRFDVERCTGLYDSNGKLIYQGDIIERCETSFNLVKHFCRAVYVDPLYACFYEMLPGDYVRYPLDYNSAAKCKVVGNINEDIDLLGLVSRYGKDGAKEIIKSMKNKQWT